MSAAPNFPPLGRGTRLRLAISSTDQGTGSSEDVSTIARVRPAVHHCPRCRHRWVEGGGPGAGSWPDLGLSYVAPLLSVPDEARSWAALLLDPPGEKVSDVARKLGVSRRQLNKRTEMYGLPSPGMWMQLGRALRAAEVMMRAPTLEGPARAIGKGEGLNLAGWFHKWWGLSAADVRAAPDPVWRWLCDRWLDIESTRALEPQP